ncbi:3-isopropylmalate/(R)-2-methylmalate dehydratase large subunit [Antricoccus suffuscus]|uniref:3-isopropylmalate/(R)-2-methylmalate dehydratase large subunit n=1 Tax=Antricoccus suffuscus TaxID=1629062 RepID=A0A2T1A0Q1_9ACTN|nr:aconitase/3-isopropylmalate dehydratase large subunit family protein [Antricoccus suffuscus]PRZ42183.1 3-isopropylmalate/(R)-2-methylmalate dehydratase large subunit [Antricoccus suffuscus]
MGSTIIEKLLARGARAEAVKPGDITVVEVDMTVLIDLQFGHDRLHDVIKVDDPDRLAVILDHAVPAPTIRDAQSGGMARAFAKRHHVSRLFDVGDHGIVHQVVAEQGLALPGQNLACTDSHTCAAGALNVAARGLGPAEVLQIVCSGKTWHLVPPTIKYELVGSKDPVINGKDIFLHIAGTYGEATDHAVEYGGPGLASLPMSDRRTIATQGAEIGADFSLFPADGLCIEMIDAVAPGAEYEPCLADDDASYEQIHQIDLGAIEPMVGRPGTVIDNAVPVSELAGTRIDQAFVGSCANGQLADLETAARMIRGHRVAPGVRMIVTPASQRVYLEAVKAGYVATLIEAGAVVTNSTCGACFGYHMGVVGPGEVCITASTRNFKGRMGSAEAQIYMASPATVVASAIAGTIVDQREVDEVVV